MSKRIKRSGLALAGAAVLAALSLTGLTSAPAKAAGPLLVATWVDGPTAGSGPAQKCLGVLGGNMTNGTPVVTWACNGHPDQTWISGVAPGNGPTHLLNSQDPSKCLGVLGAATSDGASLVIWDCNTSTDQAWLITSYTPDNSDAPTGCFKIRNQNAAPKVMGALGGTPADGTQVVIWDSLPGAAHNDQVWCPVTPGP